MEGCGAYCKGIHICGEIEKTVGLSQACPAQEYTLSCALIIFRGSGHIESRIHGYILDMKLEVHSPHTLKRVLIIETGEAYGSAG